MRKNSLLNLSPLAAIPLRPGVYLFENIRAKIIYVGKAKNLRSRVRSYFSPSATDTRYEKLVFLLSEICTVSYIEVGSEIEALLLEAELIRRNKPRYNSQWRDDKLPLYIKITRTAIPIVSLVRKEHIRPGIVLFGPFPSSNTVKMLIKRLRKIFKFYLREHHRRRMCLYCHIGMCPGPTDSLDIPRYNKGIRQLVQFLSGKKALMLKQAQKDMKRFSEMEEFERAGTLKRFIEAVEYVTAPIREPHVYIERPMILQEQRQETLQRIAELLDMKETPARIEGYDVANLSGKEATGSLVVMQAGQLEKSGYRKFRIKTVDKPDDLAMLREVLTRRFHNNWPLPQLIVVDGGITQVRVVKKVLSENNLDIPCVGIAKREELLYFPSGYSLKLSRRDPALALLQTLRDESHRFSRWYHHHLRSRTLH